MKRLEAARSIVLILVLMEDTHWVGRKLFYLSPVGVLILVLMEDTHWVNAWNQKANPIICLNPCFNGRYSLSFECYQVNFESGGLNPCFNGRYSLRKSFVDFNSRYLSLNPCFNGRYSLRKLNKLKPSTARVLILVLMEDTHWAIILKRHLNPSES